MVADMVDGLDIGDLFEDPDFPANTSSLSYSDPNGEYLNDITWQRPHEISEDPHMFVDGVSRTDVKQGDLGDCWFLSVCAALSRKPELIEKVYLSHLCTTPLKHCLEFITKFIRLIH